MKEEGREEKRREEDKKKVKQVSKRSKRKRRESKVKRKSQCKSRTLIEMPSLARNNKSSGCSLQGLVRVRIKVCR